MTTQESASRAGTPSPAEAAGVRRAVILAAGKGERLRPLTDALPKCLVELNGEPLLLRSLRSLARQGIGEVVIVVGYKGELIRLRVGEQFEGMSVTYVDAPDYASTNNIRSLWEARATLDCDLLLLEADLVFDDEVIASVLRAPASAAAVAPYHDRLSGTVVEQNGEGLVRRILMGAEQGDGFDPNGTFKTVNIYLLRRGLLAEQLLPRLEARIADGDVHDYYESVLRDCVSDGALSDLSAVDVSSARWWEVDDHRDLETASFLFLDRESQFDRIEELHGSYWRYGFVDHSYLYNMYFPPAGLEADLHRDLGQILRNYPVGQAELQRLVADWVGGDAENLAVANGAAELIKVLGSMGGRLAIPTPSFNEYEAVVEPDRLERLPLEGPHFDLDVDRFAHFAIERRCDWAVLVSPNNPTARSVARADVLRLADRLAEADCRLVVDESFTEFSAAGASASVEDALNSCPTLAVVKSMSKVFGIAGLRLGYLRSGDPAFVAAVHGALPIWNVNGLAEAFLRAVGRYRRDFERSCSLTRSAYLDLYADLDELAGLVPIAPDANFVMCRLQDGLPDGPSVARRLYVEHNILIKDCAGKSMPEASRYLRLASRTPEENRRLVAALRSVLAASDVAS